MVFGNDEKVRMNLNFWFTIQVLYESKGREGDRERRGSPMDRENPPNPENTSTIEKWL